MRKIISLLAIIVSLSFTFVNVHADGPYAGQPRKITLTSSAPSLSTNTAITLIASSRSILDPDQKLIATDELNVSIEGGDGTLDNLDDGIYSRYSSRWTWPNGPGSLRMDHICYNNKGGKLNGDYLIRNVGTMFGDIEIRPFGTTCSLGYTETGWHTAKFYAPIDHQFYAPNGDTRFIDQVNRLRLTNFSVDDTSIIQYVTVTARRPSTSGVANIQLSSLQSQKTAIVGDDVSSIVFASVDGLPVNCNASSGNNGEDGSNNGCYEDRNGYIVPLAETLSLNQITASSPSLGSLNTIPSTPDTSVNHLQLFSRGNGLTDASTQRVLTSLGGGAYIMLGHVSLPTGTTTGTVGSGVRSGAATKYNYFQVQPRRLGAIGL